MTLKIGQFKITLFKFELIERFPVQIDHETAKRDADEMTQSAWFQQLKAQAQQVRAERAI